MTPQIIWQNSDDGNNHSLILEHARLQLKVIKPDGAQYSSPHFRTKGTVDEWRDAFEFYEGGWYEIHQDISKEGLFIAIRIIHLPNTTEIATWKVHHTKSVEGPETRYVLNDKFVVL